VIICRIFVAAHFAHHALLGFDVATSAHIFDIRVLFGISRLVLVRKVPTTTAKATAGPSTPLLASARAASLRMTLLR